MPRKPEEPCPEHRAIIGPDINGWTVLDALPGRKWLCRCLCGSERLVEKYDVIKGKSKNCGCVRLSEFVERVRTRSTTHGKSKSPEYRTWINLIVRCYDKNNASYHRYGAKGVTVCVRWLDSFENFFADMGPRPSARHSIDRKDNYGNYESGNCRWATPAQQQRNKSDNRIVTHNGVSMTVTEWCEKLDLNRSKVFGRLRRGWSVKNALAST